MSTIWYFYVAVLCDEWFGAGITRICLGKFPSPQIGLNTGDQQQSSEPKSTKKNDIDVVACFSSYLFIVFLLLVPTSLQCFTQRCAPNRVKRQYSQRWGPRICKASWRTFTLAHPGMRRLLGRRHHGCWWMDGLLKELFAEMRPKRSYKV